ncbi:MAG: glycoside hydrolase family 38 C-terminal domain-containing protein [Planctomycetota bacterium]
MLPTTHFQQLLLPRFTKTRRDLSAQIWRVDPSALAVSQTKPTKAHRPWSAVGAEEFRAVKRTPLHWGRMFDQCWWKVAVPEPEGGEAVRYLFWDDRGEATVYVDGEPVYGVDPGHKYAPIPAGARELVVESLCARTGIWVKGETQGVDGERGSLFRGAYLAERDDAAWRAYHDLDVLIGLMSLLDKPEYPAHGDMWSGGGYRPEVTVVEPLLRRLIHRTSAAVDALETRGLEAFCRSTRAIYDEFRGNPDAPDAMKAVLTGHAHIDLVWLWPERAGEFKAVHSFANALNMMERYPEMTFGYSQPASYEAVQRRSPELMRRVRRQVKRGRWEATGALYVESDVQLPCGEALVRAFALGQAGFRGLTGRDSRCVWIPDVFGYSAALPTIMAGFGVPYFYTTKMHWSGATRFPHSSFRWAGMDGSEVVAHLSWTHYNQTVTPAELRHSANQHRQSHVHDEALFPTGYGDGGGGVSEAMCERARRLSDLASLPRAEWGTIEGFFDRLAERAEALPSWRGEMYLEYHRGVQTTNGRLKAAFRAAEAGLQVWEAVRCATGGGPVDEDMWKRVCFAQFHDYIPGSSIAEVYEEHVPELESIAERALAHAEDELESAGGRPCVFNPMAAPRRTWIDGRLVELPPLSGVAFDELEALPADPVTATKTRLRNGRVDARFNAAGELKSLDVDGEPVALEQPGAAVWTFPDRPANYDAWDIDRYSLSNGTHHRGRAEVDVTTEDGVGQVAFTRQLGDLGEVTVAYRLEPGDAVLRLAIDLDLAEPETLVKLAFPTAYRGREARYGGPFGSTMRPQWPGPLANDAMFENPASRWAVVTDEDQRDGLMLVTQSKYGVGVRDGLMHLSLARSALITPTGVSGDTTTIGTGGTRQYTDLGRQAIRLAVGRFHHELPLTQQPAYLADALYLPTPRYLGRPLDAGFRGLDAPASLVPAWAVPNGDRGWTLRLHETLGSRGQARLRLDDNRSATPVDLRGETMDTNTSAHAVKPYALMSFKVF